MGATPTISTLEISVLRSPSELHTHLNLKIGETIDLVNKFDGCTYLLKEGEQKIELPPKTLVAPNGIVSWHILIKQVVNFEIGKWVVISLFIGIFASIGAGLALLKQFLALIKKRHLIF